MGNDSVTHDTHAPWPVSSGRLLFRRGGRPTPGAVGHAVSGAQAGPAATFGLAAQQVRVAMHSICSP